MYIYNECIYIKDSSYISFNFYLKAIYNHRMDLNLGRHENEPSSGLVLTNVILCMEQVVDYDPLVTILYRNKHHHLKELSSFQPDDNPQEAALIFYHDHSIQLTAPVSPQEQSMKVYIQDGK